MPAAVTSHGRRIPRRLAEAAIVAAAIGLGWLCLRQIVPDWRAGDPEALSARAIAAFSRAETPAARGGAEAALRGALRRSPLDARLLRTLAVAAELRGDRARAVATMAVAGARGWRDTLTQVWLFSDAVARGDDAAASLHADAVLRQTPELQPNLFPVMIASMRDRAAAVAPYVARLTEAPDWRRGFLPALLAPGVDAAVARGVFHALAATGAPPTDAESDGLIARLVADQDYAGARAEWARRLPSRPAGWIHDGDFAGLPGLAPFNWRLVNGDGAVAETTRTPDGATALHAQAPAVANTLLAEQLLTLPPGAYRLTGAARIEPGQAMGALFSWRITCLAAGDPLVAEAQVGAGPAGWRAFSVAFETPPQGCGAQWLRLSGLAHEGFDPASGLFRALRVEAVPSSAP